jgi:hypothetical protein
MMAGAVAAGVDSEPEQRDDSSNEEAHTSKTIIIHT